MSRRSLFASGTRRPQRDYLFRSFDVFQIREEQKATAIANVDALSMADFDDKSLDEVVSDLSAKFALIVPKIDQGEVSVNQREVDIEVKDFDRYITVKGTAIDVQLPFVGLGKYLETRPSRYDLNPPEGRVRGDVIEFSIQGRSLDASKVEEQIDERITSIQSYLDNLSADFQQHNDGLGPMLQPYIERRKAKLDSDRDLTSKLKYKKRDSD